MLSDPALESSSYFLPLQVIPPMHVVVRRAEVARQPFTAGRLQLERLLADSCLRGAMYIQRRYPAQLEPHLRRVLRAGRLMGVAVSGSPDKQLQMLIHRRFDYTFEYPSVVMEVERSNNSISKFCTPLQPAGFSQPQTVTLLGEPDRQNALESLLILKLLLQDSVALPAIGNRLQRALLLPVNIG